MENTLNCFKERLAKDQTVLNLLRHVESKQKFEDMLILKSNEWGFNLPKQLIQNELLYSPSEINFEISMEQMDANPGFTEFSGCTDNSNLTAQRPSACLSCTTSNGGGCR